METREHPTHMIMLGTRRLRPVPLARVKHRRMTKPDELFTVELGRPTRDSYEIDVEPSRSTYEAGIEVHRPELIRKFQETFHEVLPERVNKYLAKQVRVLPITKHQYHNVLRSVPVATG